MHRKSECPTLSTCLVALILLTLIVPMGSCIGNEVGERKAEMYDKLYQPLITYLDGQRLAREREGTYVPLVMLQRMGYVPGEFPRTTSESDTHYELAESNITADTFTVECRPLGSHFESYDIVSLWMDQTGVVRVGSIDGPAFISGEPN